ncbi:MAG: TRAP transporter large permease [Burkholderiales bacterium]|nr:TRAP transporter large permease [Burkholderiales bacterium]
MELFVIATLAVVTLAIGVPIGFVILLTCFLLIFNDPFVNLGAVPAIFVQGMDSFILLSIPLFVLVGVIMNAGGLSQRLLDLAVVMVGHLRAGIAHVNIVASMIFSGISGTTTSDVAGLGRIEIPMMVKEGFRPETAAVITAVSATIGPIIPPSVPFILYGALTSTSIGKLFLGGLIPGILLGLWLMAVVALLAHRGQISSARYMRGRASLASIGVALRRSFWALLTPFILVGGIVTGWFTATEAAGVAVVYAILVTCFVYRTVSFRELFAMFCESAEYVGIIMMVVAAASVFGWLIIQAGAAAFLLDLIRATGQGPMVTLIIINLILLVMGMFVEATSMIILLAPILMPLVQQTGVDPVHFGVVFTLNMMIATVTPPIGMCGIIASDIAGVSMQKFSREVIPYVLAMIAFLFFILFFPPIVTYLPNLIFS